MASRRKKARRNRWIRTILAVVVVLAAVCAALLFTVGKKYTPSKERTDYTSHYALDTEQSMIVVFNQTQSEQNGIYADGEVYLAYEFVRDSLNSRFYWDGREQILRYVIPEGIISVKPEQASYQLGKSQKETEQILVKVEDGKMYLSMKFVLEHTNIHGEFYEEPNRVVLSDQWGEVTYTQMKKSTQVREKGGIKSPILCDLSKGDLVTVLEEMDSWSMVCTEDGFIGYVKKSALGSRQTVLYDNNYEEPQFAHIRKEEPICLAWHQVTNQTANGLVGNVLNQTKGVNVISPTWFYLNDNEGGIASLANAAYVEYCHQRGVEVWALVSNLENSEVNSTTVLNRTGSRDNLVNNLIAQAIQYNLDGINVDFESLKAEAGGGYLEFLRELSVKCENNDLVLSVDNYVPAPYNTFYDRAEQAVFADYLIVMAYDEHYKGSDAGSVASIGFVKKGVADTLEEVPADQLILGIPFYNRLWKLEPAAEEAGDGETGQTSEQTSAPTYTTSSEALGMAEAESRVSANGARFQWLEDCGQYYAEYENDSCIYKLWLEDVNSIEEKLKVMKSNDLAGAAFWKLGYEKASVWTKISEYLK